MNFVSLFFSMWLLSSSLSKCKGFSGDGVQVFRVVPVLWEVYPFLLISLMDRNDTWRSLTARGTLGPASEFVVALLETLGCDVQWGFLCTRIGGQVLGTRIRKTVRRHQGPWYRHVYPGLRSDWGPLGLRSPESPVRTKLFEVNTRFGYLGLRSWWRRLGLESGRRCRFLVPDQVTV